MRPEDPPPPSLPASTVRLFAATTGLAVANLYYHQPLLAEIARDFGVPLARAGYVSTVTQTGYALGLLLFVPLGDARERRRLIVLLLLAVAVALAGAALAPSLGALAAASFAVGVTTVVPQLVIPFAAGLAPPATRGRVVGLVMGGLLVGILGGRVVSGLIGSAFGWRASFAVAAVLMLALAAVARSRFPLAPPPSRLGYGALLRSLGSLVRSEPVVRDAAAIGALSFGAFSAFWTTLAFRLETPPLDHGARVAGLFGLVGIAGALSAPLVGRLSDLRSPRATVGVGLLVSLAAWAGFLAAGHTLWGLALGVVLLDVGAQATGVSNQARIYALPAELHGRLNTVYMVSFFLGGSVGSSLGSWAWGVWRWAGVCGVGIGMLGLALALFARRGDGAAPHMRRGRRPAAVPSREESRLEIEHEPERSRFVAVVEGGEAVLEYSTPREGVIDLRHTFVPREARGEGWGAALVETALGHARRAGLKVVATCPFARAWLSSHPGHEELLA